MQTLWRRKTFFICLHHELMMNLQQINITTLVFQASTLNRNGGGRSPLLPQKLTNVENNSSSAPADQNQLWQKSTQTTSLGRRTRRDGSGEGEEAESTLLATIDTQGPKGPISQQSNAENK